MRAVRRASATARRGAGVRGAGGGADPAPTVVDPKLEVRTVTTGLTQPVQMEFIGDNDFFVLEKATGMVKRVKNGGDARGVLDLTVNSNSERGLLGIALDQDFKLNGHASTCTGARARPAPTAPPGDTVPLLGNRLDRFHWDGTRADLREDAAPRPRASRTT